MFVIFAVTIVGDNHGRSFADFLLLRTVLETARVTHSRPSIRTEQVLFYGDGVY